MATIREPFGTQGGNSLNVGTAGAGFTAALITGTITIEWAYMS